MTGQRTLARALATERRARLRGDDRTLKAAIRRTSGARNRLARAGKRLTQATAAAERRCD